LSFKLLLILKHVEDDRDEHPKKMKAAFRGELEVKMLVITVAPLTSTA
jgi:hypothetical protein